MKTKTIFSVLIISALFAATALAQITSANSLSKVGGLKLPDAAYGLFSTSSHNNKDSTFAGFVNYAASFSLWVGAVNAQGDSLVTAGTGNLSGRRPEWAPIHPSFALKSNSGLPDVNKSASLAFADGVTFDDHTPLGLHVEQTIYEFSNSGFAIVDYRIAVAAKTTALKNVYAGLWADVDAPDVSNRVAAADDIVGFSQGNLAAYIYNNAAKNRAGARLGAKILGTTAPIVSWWQLEDDPAWDADKYSYLSGAAPNTQADTPGDWRFLLSDGPYALSSGDTLQFAIAIVQAPDETSFESNLNMAEAFFVQNLKSATLKKTQRLSNPTEVADAATPEAFYLHPNYPNPFNPSTVINYQLPMSSAVNLSIYNLTGQLVRTLVDGPVEDGVHSVVWDAKNDAGQRVPSGVYFVRLQASDLSASAGHTFVQTRKVVLAR